jgi:hypothetical protein
LTDVAAKRRFFPEQNQGCKSKPIVDQQLGIEKGLFVSQIEKAGVARLFCPAAPEITNRRRRQVAHFGRIADFCGEIRSRLGMNRPRLVVAHSHQSLDCRPGRSRFQVPTGIG